MELYNKKLTDLTLIELNNLINRTTEVHNQIKANIDTFLDEYDNLETNIKKEVESLKKVEKQYVELVTELNNR